MSKAPALPLLPADRRTGAERPLLAIALVLSAVAVFSLSDTLSKLLAERLDPVEVVCGRYLVILALLSPAVLRRPRLALTQQPLLQLLRGIPLLGEQIGIRRWSAVAVGFLGVLVVTRPGSGAIGAAAALPLLSAACWALAIVLTRRMRGADLPVTTLAYSTTIGFVLSALALPLVWRPPSLGECGMLVAMGMLNAGGQYLFIAGLIRGAASMLAPFSYSQMIWSTLMGYLVFGAVPVAWTWAGAGLVVGSGVYIAHRERLRARRA